MMLHPSVAVLRCGLLRHGLLGLAVVAVMALPAAAQKDLVAETPKANTGNSSDDSVINYINERIRIGWRDNEVGPSVEAPEGKWIRRLFLDLIGRTPTLEETQAFLTDKSPNKKAVWVNKLLDQEGRYAMEFANNWATIWTNLLIGRNGGNDRERPVNRTGLEKYLRDSILRNKPYDRIVFELISANGNNTPGESGFNGATNFLLDNLQEGQVPATNKVSQLFLGLRVGCTQCHNHPFNEWKQDQFWSMNAFFKQAKALRTFQGRDVVSAELQDQDFAGEGGDPEEAEIYYELRNGILKVAYPRFVDGTTISPVGYADEVNRRDELAKLVIKSPYMREAIVNRIWGHFFGYGFTKPVDDMGPHNPPSHPELLARVGNEFATYGHDLRRLMRWYTLTEAYSLSSNATPMNRIDDPAKGEVPLFTHFYIRQMSAEQLYGTLMTATEVDKSAKSIEERNKIRNAWLQQFVVGFGTDENDEATTFNGTIPQALMLMNGKEIQDACACKPGSFLHRVVSANSDPSKKIKDLYVAALGRQPKKIELQVANQLVLARSKGAKNPKQAVIWALQDVWWALLNSNEFILQH